MCANTAHVLDVRGLPPPEPFEMILGALQKLEAGECLDVQIHREPLPLYELLPGAGYVWQTTQAEDGSFLIRIRRG